MKKVNKKRKLKGFIHRKVRAIGTSRKARLTIRAIGADKIIEGNPIHSFIYI